MASTKESAEVIVPVAYEKSTKNTVRFLEVKENDFAAEKLGQIYVPNGTMAALGFTDLAALNGQELEVVIRRK